MPTTKTGEKITYKEFFKRWGSGIKNLTPEQRLINESRGTFLSLIGFIVSLIAMIIYHDKFIVSWFAYGLILVFVGSIWVTGVKYLVIKQQIKQLKSFEENCDISDIDNILDQIKIKEDK